MENLQSGGNSKAPLIISIVSLVFVVLVGVGLFFVNQVSLDNLEATYLYNQVEVGEKLDDLYLKMDSLVVDDDVFEVADVSLDSIVGGSTLTPMVGPDPLVRGYDEKLSCAEGEYCRKGLCVDENKPNEFGCHPAMTCSSGEVCRSGLCVKSDVAIDQFGCHPAMTCDAGEVCRSGLCVKSDVAIDQYGCHPAMTCDAGQVCRNGLCVDVKDACEL